METTQGTDRRIGMSATFGVLGLLGAVVMLAAGVGDDQLLAAWGFAAAMLFATLLVVALHLYDWS